MPHNLYDFLSTQQKTWHMTGTQAVRGWLGVDIGCVGPTILQMRTQALEGWRRQLGEAAACCSTSLGPKPFDSQFSILSDLLSLGLETFFLSKFQVKLKILVNWTWATLKGTVPRNQGLRFSFLGQVASGRKVGTGPSGGGSCQGYSNHSKGDTKTETWAPHRHAMLSAPPVHTPSVQSGETIARRALWRGAACFSFVMLLGCPTFAIVCESGMKQWKKSIVYVLQEAVFKIH